MYAKKQTNKTRRDAEDENKRRISSPADHKHLSLASRLRAPIGSVRKADGISRTECWKIKSLKKNNRRRKSEEEEWRKWLGLDSWQHFLQLLVQKASSLENQHTGSSVKRVNMLLAWERRQAEVKMKTKFIRFGLERSAPKPIIKQNLN